jgi:cbb3-type cytochrome oxidase subunit 3
MINFVVTHAKEIGLIFFVCFFCAVVVQVYVRGQKTTYQDYANIPLKED